VNAFCGIHLMANININRPKEAIMVIITPISHHLGVFLGDGVSAPENGRFMSSLPGYHSR
jgi:hypothetical protein